MAVELIFTGTERSNTEHIELTTFINLHKEITLKIKVDDNVLSFISLDKQTAIRFQKELRKQISYLNEDNNE